MGRNRELPPPLEMMCLNALWEIGEGNVEDVRRLVAQDRVLAYTTVLTLLGRGSEAIEAFRRAVELVPQNPAARCKGQS